MIDPKALTAANQAWDETELMLPKDLTKAMKRSALRRAIEAYEAARPEPNPWRPIEELPRDGTEFYVYIHNAYIQPGMMVWPLGGGLQTPLGRIVETDIEHLSRVGAMFRTIDPPPKSGDEE